MRKQGKQSKYEKRERYANAFYKMSWVCYALCGIALLGVYVLASTMDGESITGIVRPIAWYAQYGVILCAIMGITAYVGKTAQKLSERLIEYNKNTLVQKKEV